MSDAIIQIKNVSKWFDKFQALKNINLEVKKKEKLVEKAANAKDCLEILTKKD